MIDYATSENPLKAASGRLNTELKKVSDKPILLLLSGGSALAILDKIDTSVLDHNFTVAPLDERYSWENEVNNFAQIAATVFYEKAKKVGCKFIDTRVKNDETREELANRFENSLKQWPKENPVGKVIATVGIGPDGHISGMMPYPKHPKVFKDLFETDKLVRAYNAEERNEYPVRVTTTMNLMRKIDLAIVYAVGEGKREALLRLKADKGSLAATPARILLEMKNVVLFTDQQV